MPITALQSHKLSATDALRQAVMALQQAHIETASLDARLLLQFVLDVSREQLLADSRLKLTPHQESRYHDLIEKRKSRAPVAQLIGKREFWGRDFKVTEATLDPRPDSETLIDAVLDKFRDNASVLRILDLGTGTGCLLLTLLGEYKNASGIGVDKCAQALAVAKENAMRLELAERADFVQSCWNENIEGTFDIIISNPPYIATGAIAGLAPEVAQYEPKGALDGGPDGLDCYRAIMAEIPKLLAENGLAVFEIGMGQERDLEELALANALRVTGHRQDLSGITRCVLVQK